jgi:hypothetical protein
MTTDPNRRIRQHNGELVGGAKATMAKQPYKIYCKIAGFPTINEALSYEWNIKHPDRKRKIPVKYRGIIGRIEGLKYVMTVRPPVYKIIIYIESEYKHILDEIQHDNIEILDMN